MVDFWGTGLLGAGLWDRIKGFVEGAGSFEGRGLRDRKIFEGQRLCSPRGGWQGCMGKPNVNRLPLMKTILARIWFVAFVHVCCGISDLQRRNVKLKQAERNQLAIGLNDVKLKQLGQERARTTWINILLTELLPGENRGFLYGLEDYFRYARPKG